MTVTDHFFADDLSHDWGCGVRTRSTSSKASANRLRIICCQALPASILLLARIETVVHSLGHVGAVGEALFPESTMHFCDLACDGIDQLGCRQDARHLDAGHLVPEGPERTHRLLECCSDLIVRRGRADPGLGHAETKVLM